MATFVRVNFELVGIFSADHVVVGQAEVQHIVERKEVKFHPSHLSEIL